MTQAYMQSGNTFHPVDQGAMNLKPILPPGTYTIGATPKGFHLEKVEDFKLPGKLYGDIESRAARIMNTFDQRPAGTGVLLAGQKGSGKTMLTKTIAIKLLERGIITILVNQALCGEGFNAFIQSIDQPAAILFDEFEKTYDREDQAKLLTIFDGTYPSKKLFLLTCNERFRIDQYMLNRPGRLFYFLEFGSLDRTFIEEYCSDNLLAKENTKGVVTVSQFFMDFSFDMLKALVEEMNRYSETAAQAMQMLNMRPTDEGGSTYDVWAEHTKLGRLVGGSYCGEVMRCNPISPKAHGYEYDIYPARDDEEGAKKAPPRAPNEVGKHMEVVLDQTKLISVSEGYYVFGTKDKDVTLHCKRRPEPVIMLDYAAL